MPITLYNSCIFFSTIVSITYVCKSLQNMYNSLQHIPASISIALPACIGSVAYKQTWQPFAKISFCSFTIQQNLTPTFANNVRYRAALIEHFALVFPFDFDRDLRALVGRRVILAFAYNFANNSLVLRRRDVFALLTWQRRTWFFRLFKKNSVYDRTRCGSSVFACVRKTSTAARNGELQSAKNPKPVRGYVRHYTERIATYLPSPAADEANGRVMQEKRQKQAQQQQNAHLPVKQLDFKDKGGILRYLWRAALLTVGVLRLASQNADFSPFHGSHTDVPSSDNLSCISQSKTHWKAGLINLFRVVDIFTNFYQSGNWRQHTTIPLMKLGKNATKNGTMRRAFNAFTIVYKPSDKKKSITRHRLKMLNNWRNRTSFTFTSYYEPTMM